MHVDHASLTCGCVVVGPRRGSVVMTAATKRAAGNLPVDLTSFVGRRARDGRHQAGARPVPPGHAGRRRRGREDPAGDHMAAEVRRALQDGAWFVDLSPLQDEDLLVVDGGEGPSAAEPVARRGRRRRLPATSPIATSSSCWTTASRCGTPAPYSSTRSSERVPSLRVLATSRQALGDLRRAAHRRAPTGDARP